jgi:hypothetical protein
LGRDRGSLRPAWTPQSKYGLCLDPHNRRSRQSQKPCDRFIGSSGCFPYRSRPGSHFARTEGVESQCQHRSRGLRNRDVHEWQREKPRAALFLFGSVRRIVNGSRPQLRPASKPSQLGFVSPCLPQSKDKPVNFKLGHYPPP